MSLTLVTWPVVEPVTLAEAKAHCKEELPDNDALLAGYILAARQHVENETQRAIITQTFDYKAASTDGLWPVYWDGQCYTTGIKLPMPPLQSVTSVNYVDTSGNPQLLATDQYQVVKTNGDSLEGIVVPAYGVAWPGLRPIFDAVTVRFTSGYGGLESVPHAIRQAILMLVGEWFAHREAVISGTIIAELPLAVRALLAPFRVY